MTTILEYQCDICRRRYKSVESAIECEAKGLYPIEQMPAGLLKKVKWEKGKYGMFALSNNMELSTSSHLINELWWAYRSWEKFGEEIIDLKNFDLCGMGYLPHPDTFKKYHWLNEEDLKLRESKWLIHQLKANNIIPSYYNKEGILIKIK